MQSTLGLAGSLHCCLISLWRVNLDIMQVSILPQCSRNNSWCGLSGVWDLCSPPWDLLARCIVAKSLISLWWANLDIMQVSILSQCSRNNSWCGLSGVWDLYSPPWDLLAHCIVAKSLISLWRANLDIMQVSILFQCSRNNSWCGSSGVWDLSSPPWDLLARCIVANSLISLWRVTLDII